MGSWFGFMKMVIKLTLNMEEKDLIIDGLLKKVEEKRRDIEIIKHAVFKTNMSLTFELTKGSLSTVYNLHTLDENSLLLFLARIEHMMSSIADTRMKYSIENQYVHHGFSLVDWRDDILTKLKMAQSSRKLKELKVLETKLNNLMSQEKKEMLEILEIKKLLGLL